MDCERLFCLPPPRPAPFAGPLLLPLAAPLPAPLLLLPLGGVVGTRSLDGLDSECSSGCDSVAAAAADRLGEEVADTLATAIARARLRSCPRLCVKNMVRLSSSGDESSWSRLRMADKRRARAPYTQTSRESHSEHRR